MNMVTVWIGAKVRDAAILSCDPECGSLWVLSVGCGCARYAFSGSFDVDDRDYKCLNVEISFCIWLARVV